MKLSSELPAYYSRTIQSGYNKKRLNALSETSEESLELIRSSRYRALIFEWLSVMFLNIPQDLFPSQWLSLLYFAGAFRPCSDLSQASHVVASYRDEVRSGPLPLSKIEGQCYFEYQCIRYIQAADGNSFSRISPAEFEKGPALTTDQVSARRERYGQSSYSAHLSPSPMGALATILKEQVLLSPLIYFEIFCVFMWTITKYTTYSIVIVLLVVVERSVAIRQSLQTWAHLHSISCDADEQPVIVVRLAENGKEERRSIFAKDVVPGDHIMIAPNMYIPCDCVLIKGEVIADVSLVTGESTSSRCNAVPPSKSIKPSSVTSSLLLCGSRVLRTRAPGGARECRAIVVASGFHTLQGNFLLSVLFRDPSPAEERMEFWFVRSAAALMALAAVCMVYTYFVSVSLDLHPIELTVRVFDILTDALPPALPLAVSIAALTASVRLPLYVSSARSGRLTHLLAGLVNKVVLDKTNTVTTTEMLVTGVLEVSSQAVTKRPTKGSLLEAAVAACNYLAVITGREIVGDPLEIALLKSIGWEVDCDDDSFVKRSATASPVSRASMLSPVLETSTGNVETLNSLLIGERSVLNTIQILASFPFNPSTMRMSVIAKCMESERLFAFSKGAFEHIIAKCDKDSVPFALPGVYEKLSGLGYRILAYAAKSLPRDAEPECMNRDETEADMHFVGIVLMSNELHPNSKAAIHQLRKSNIKVYLCTGDSSGTATAVARQSGISTKLDDPGPSEAFMYRAALTEPLLNGEASDVVLSRMTPDDKAVFVESLAAKERIGAVLMCGDGPNDANALCAADVGVVVNSSPNPLLESAAGCMVCLDPKVGLNAIVDIIRLGRSGLAVTICIAKIIIAYAVVEGSCVALCYSLGDNLTDFQYSVVDMCIVLPTVLLLGLAAQPVEYIEDSSPVPPFKVHAIGLGFQCALCVGWQGAALLVLKAQDWYEPFRPSGGMLAGPHEWEHSSSDLTGHENTVLFTMCCFQCVLLIVTFTDNTLSRWCMPLKDSPIVLFWLRGIAGIALMMVAAITILQSTEVGKWIMMRMDLVPLQGMFIFQLAALMISQTVVALVWEWAILPRIEREIVLDLAK